MNSNPQSEEALFQAAIHLAGVARDMFLTQECGADAALRCRLDALIAAHEQESALLTTPSEDARPTIKVAPLDGSDEAVGQTLGRYKLLEKIGEGGCGVVYVAEQSQPV